MTRHRFFKRLLPIVLSAMLLFSVLPMSASANDESTNEVASKIVREVVELREESVKHFLCEDGSYIAVSYAEPVHYEKNGEWLEIDNTLVLSSKNTYVPKSNDLAVSIPQSFSGGGKIIATNKGHTISFGVASSNENVALSKTAAVKAVEALPSSIAADVSVETLANAELSATATVGKVDTVAQIEAYNSEKTTVDNQAGALVYDKIFPNADLEYIVTGNSIKENVVVYQPQKEYVYTFDMDFGGLTPVAEEDGSYRLIDSAKPDETVFVLAAPYMYDANGEESYEVAMSLTENGENYLLTLTADEAWINNSERAFPVVIDPTLYYNFDDVFVINGLYGNSTRITKELRVGRNIANVTRTYIKVPEPEEIPVGSKINSAELVLTKKAYYEGIAQDDIDISIYDCKNVANWTATSVTWNNQPFGDYNNSYKTYKIPALDTLDVTRDITTYRFDILPAVESWIETGINKGFMLASSDEETRIQVDFYSSRANIIDPLIIVNYDLPNLSTSAWTTDQNAATSPAITVSSTKNWTASANQSWISVSPSGGAGGDSFTISVTENPNASARTGEVTVMIGTTIIGKVEVTQAGSDPFLSVSNTDLSYKPDEQNITQVVTVNANEDWSIPPNTSSSAEESWFSVDKTADNELTFTLLQANNTNATRNYTVTVTTASGLKEEITITQFDEVSLYFNKIKPDRSASRKSSSEYNHPLAQWAMELSYAAYNYPSGLTLPPIPGLFMGDIDYTAADVLHNYGFVDDNPEDDVEENIWEVNYTPVTGIAAHTIGHREITIINNSTIGDDENGNSGTNLNTANVINGDFPTIETSDGSILSDIIGSSGENTLLTTVNNTRPLVVVVVRGSVTLEDWKMNAATQFNSKKEQFCDGMEMVYDSLYGYEECEQCNGNDLECECNGYLAINEINDPIILITGHSLGAAIANLLAAELSATLGVEDVYAYTFGTPQVVTESLGQEAIPYPKVTFSF